eukprot:352473-Chlamydomonas_euryale.AAC.7
MLGVPGVCQHTVPRRSKDSHCLFTALICRCQPAATAVTLVCITGKRQHSWALEARRRPQDCTRITYESTHRMADPRRCCPHHCPTRALACCLGSSPHGLPLPPPGSQRKPLLRATWPRSATQSICSVVHKLLGDLLVGRDRVVAWQQLALRIVLEQLVREHNRDHGFDHGHRAWHDTRVVAATRAQLRLDAVAVYRLLVLPDGRRRLEPNPHDNVLAVGDAALDAAGTVGRRANLTFRRHVKGVIVLRALHLAAFKARADFKALGGWQRHHRLGELRLEL